MKVLLLYTSLILLMFAGGCKHQKHVSSKSHGADPKYAPCHCNDWK